MKVTHRRDWPDGLKSGFAGAGPDARAYQSDDGENLAIVEPAEEFDGQLLAVEWFVDPENDPIRFLCPDQETVDFMLEALLEG